MGFSYLDPMRIEGLGELVYPTIELTGTIALPKAQKLAIARVSAPLGAAAAFVEQIAYKDCYLVPIPPSINDVAFIQAQLTKGSIKYNRPQYNPKGIDGIVGPNTLFALKSFVSTAGMDVSQLGIYPSTAFANWVNTLTATVTALPVLPPVTQYIPVSPLPSTPSVAVKPKSSLKPPFSKSIPSATGIVGSAQNLLTQASQAFTSSMTSASGGINPLLIIIPAVALVGLGGFALLRKKKRR